METGKVEAVAPAAKITLDGAEKENVKTRDRGRHDTLSQKGGHGATRVVNSDTNKPAPLANKPTIDLVEWKNMAENTIRRFCTQNGLDATKFFVDEEKGSAPQKQITIPARPQSHNSITQLLRVFKSLEKLLAETNFPSEEAVTLLKPLAGSFFVKKSAYYWHCLVKAAVTARDYPMAVDCLDRATNLKAEPIMELQRAYGFVCHRMLDVIRAGNLDQAAAGKPQPTPDITINENDDPSVVSNGQQLYSETEEVLEVAVESDHQQIGTVTNAPAEDEQVPTEVALSTDTSGAQRESDNETGPVQNNNGSSGSGDITTGDIASTRRSVGRGRLDESQVFKSSTTKLLVMQNKWAKKENDAIVYRITPVRRSTRKAADYDKWHAYRSTTVVDTPGDVTRFCIKMENSEFKKNPYLPSDSDTDE